MGVGFQGSGVRLEFRVWGLGFRVEDEHWRRDRGVGFRTGEDDGGVVVPEARFYFKSV